MLKKNYENTLAFIDALKFKQQRENDSRDRARKRVVEMHRSSSHETINGVSASHRSNNLSGMNLNLNGNININYNINMNQEHQRN